VNDKDSRDSRDSKDFRISVDIDAPPARVWSVMSDVERWSNWTASITSIKRRDAGPLAVGSSAWVRQPKLPPALWKVTVLESNRGFNWVSRGPGVLVTGGHWIEPTAQGSRVTLSVGIRGLFAGLLARLTGAITDRYLGLEAAGLKRQCEALSATGSVR
jgi:uncharacterized membrane protein